MLVEDHLRLQNKLVGAPRNVSGSASSLTSANHSNSVAKAAEDLKEVLGDVKSWSRDTAGLPLDVWARFTFAFVSVTNNHLIFRL